MAKKYDNYSQAEPWPEQGAHKHVVLENPQTGKKVYITQKDKPSKAKRLLSKGWEIVDRPD